jgi:hypothetical protein
VQKVSRAPKRVIWHFKRYITGRDFLLCAAFILYKREIGAKNPWWGTGMQFAPL